MRTKHQCTRDNAGVFAFHFVEIAVTLLALTFRTDLVFVKADVQMSRNKAPTN